MQPNTLILFGLLGAVVLLLIWVVVLEIRLKKLLRGKSGQSLESVIIDIAHEVEKLLNHKTTVEGELSRIHGELKRSVKTIGTVRFNPFPDKGGNQSFATAIVNEHGDGVVISTLAAREKVGVYAKPVTKFESQFDLSDEEREALAQTRG